jgi:RHS repeat-associated protein
MGGSSRSRWSLRPSARFHVRLTSAGTSLALVLGLLVGVAAVAAVAVITSSRPPSVPGTPAVPGARNALAAKAVPAVDPARESAPVLALGWPAPRSAVADVAAVRSAGGSGQQGSGQQGTDLSSGRVTVPGTPVFVQPASASKPGPTRVAVTVGSQSAARRLGITGVVLSVAARQGSGPLTIGLDYASFADAYGGNFGERLRLVQFPACALTTPQVGRCTTQRAVPGAVNQYTRQAALATVALPATGQPVVLAATSTTYTTGDSDGGDGGGPAGSYTATTLKPSGSWSAGGSSGDFTYSYPIAVPPAASDMMPSIGLSYDSGELDGQTAATSTQANWLGDGWSTPDNFIEQSYVPCADDPGGSAAPKATADECYDGQVLTLSLNGLSTSIVTGSSAGSYVLEQDNGDVVTQVTGSGNGTKSYNTSYWVVTDRDGTKYYFGRNELPGWASGDPTTNSVDWEPVFSAHSGDPCYNATWADSVCDMAYRWNLDYVTDVHGNAMAWYYNQDTNAYLENAATSYTSMPNANATYIRDSYLNHIDYGFTDGNAYTVNGGHAPDEVTFATASRCSPSASSCPAITSSNSGSATADYPDVPYDLHCTDGDACLVSDTTFWSTVRLSGITTSQWNGSAYATVDSWTFQQAMPPTGDGTSPTLFLSSISHAGDDTSAGGPDASLPAVTFGVSATGTLDNRVNPTDSLPAITRQRITTITTETGSVITVSYELASPCTSADQASPATNTGSCYPVWWTPAGLSMQKDWFNKYQVASVTQSDPTGGNPAVYTGYTYLGGAAWHYDDNELVRPKYRTYAQYRGFGDVQTFTGQGTDPQTETEATYYRGMSDDNDSTAVTLTDSQKGAHDDTDQLAGQPLETTQYNYSGGPVTSSTIDSYWVSAAAATRDRSGLPALTANATGLVEEWTRTALHSGSTTTWRDTETDTSYYASPSSPYFGLAQYTYTHGDLSLSGDSQVRCTTTTYAPANTSENLVGLVAEVETDADPCGGTSPDGATAPTAAQVNALTAPASVSRPADVVSDVRTVYDDPALAQAWPQPSSISWPQATPTKGDISEVLDASGYASGAFTYQAKSAAVYDSVGRVVASYDGNGNETTTAYTANSYGLTTGIATTNPLGQSSNVTLDPMRGLTVGTSDLNGITTTMHYDGLGRVIAEWGQSRSPTTTPANATFSYAVSNSAPTAVTENVLNDAGGYATSTTLYDALLRVRQTQGPTPQGGRLVTDTFYDSRGWPWKVNSNWWDSSDSPGPSLATVNGNPIPDSQVANQTVTAFDGLGRAVLVTSYDDSAVKSQTATAYDQAASGDGDATITVPLGVSGQPFSGAPATATVTDALGRTSQLDQYSVLPSVTVTTSAVPVITTVAVAGGTTQATDYLFDNAGHQTEVEDEATGQDWTAAYNLLGEATSRNDPDSGTTSALYDGDGNVVQTTDANGNTLSWTYDGLDRKTAEYSVAVTAQSGANEIDSWAYDNSNDAVSGMTNPDGELTTATRYVGGTGGSAYTEQAGGYNAFGEITSETITLPSSEGALGTSYKFVHTYEANTGNPEQDAYPASPDGGELPAETVTHGYGLANGLELPTSLAGLDSYGVNVTYTALDQVGQEEIGSNSVNAFITDTYDPNTGKLTDTNLKNTSVSSTPIDDTSYGYDAAGNPVMQTETRQGTTSETQCFAYDTLDRLTEAWTATDDCAADPSSNNGATIGDGIAGAAYWTTWTYSPLGLRTSETDHGLSGTASTTTDDDYNGADTGQVDTLTSTATTGATTGSATYTFDKDGNVTSADTTTGSTGTTQQLSWNPDGTLASVTNDPGTSDSATSSYVYDANGNLLLQKDPGTTVLYLPGEELSLNTSTGAVTGLRLYNLPGGGQAIRTGADPTTSGGTPGYVFELTDQHGTATLVIGPALTAASATWRQFTPYGQPRGPTVTWVDNLGFLNKPTDPNTGLTDLGARWYDPATGTFESIDPVFEADSPQQQNGYTYAGNNPVTAADPTGLMIVGYCSDGVLCYYHPPASHSSSGSGGDDGGDSSSLSEYNTWHNAAVQMVANYLRSIYGYKAVRTEYYIPNAHYQGAAYGRADIVLTLGNQMWVWEVKHCCGQAELVQGPKQLAVYIAALQASNPRSKVKAGFNIPQLATTDPLDSNKQLVAESTNTRFGGPNFPPLSSGNTYNGIIAYWTRNNPRQDSGQEQSGNGYTQYLPGTHVVAGVPVNGDLNLFLAPTGGDDPPPPPPPIPPAQTTVPQQEQVPCYAGHATAPQRSRAGSITLDARVTPALPAACNPRDGDEGDGDGDDGDGDGDGDGGDFGDFGFPWF